MIARKRLCHILGAVIVLAAAICADTRGGEPPTATLRVNLKETKAPVSTILYGIFLEEISHAFDGGIYTELIQNRSFEEGVPPPGMKLVKKDDGGLKMELE